MPFVKVFCQSIDNKKYFIFDFNDRNFKELETYVGGISHINKIKDYLSYGSKKSIDIFDLTGDFEINPPKAFIINPDYSFTPLYPWTKLSIETLNNRILFWADALEIQPSDDTSEGSFHYTWNFENGRWNKGILTVGQTRMYSRPIRCPLAYLSNKDAERVRANPHLLKSSQFELITRCLKSSQKGGRDIYKDLKEDWAEIMKKAREKYLAEKSDRR